MAKEHKGKSAPAKSVDTSGKHGGNRGGERKADAKRPKRSSQAAGQDPDRGGR